VLESCSISLPLQINTFLCGGESTPRSTGPLKRNPTTWTSTSCTPRTICVRFVTWIGQISRFPSLDDRHLPSFSFFSREMKNCRNACNHQGVWKIESFLFYFFRAGAWMGNSSMKFRRFPNTKMYRLSKMIQMVIRKLNFKKRILTSDASSQ